MKVKREIKGNPNGKSLNISILYVEGDIKSALLSIKKSMGQDVGISFGDLKQKLYEHATDKHMPEEPRRYIAEWMLRRAIESGFVFKANSYLGNVSNEEETFLFDEESIREKMRGRPRKQKTE